MDSELNKVLSSYYFANELNKVLSEVNYTDFSASFKLKTILTELYNFEKTLDDEHEIALKFISFGSILMCISDIKYVNPDILIFYGTINNEKAQVIQHSSQLNFIICSHKKQNPSQPARRIGFILEKN